MTTAVRPDVAVVFPATHRRGGVERIVGDLLAHLSARHRTAYLGWQAEDLVDAVEVLTPRPPRGPRLLRPWEFRTAAARLLREVRPTTTISFGAECPPGDVLWVQSVHRAWLERGAPVTLRGLAVPNVARRLLPRHQVLLRLEGQYFRQSEPRAVLCTSRQEMEDLVRIYRVPRERMHVVPNGYDPAVFSNARAASLRSATRVRMGLADAQLCFLMVANEWHRKGLAVTLEALAAADLPHARLDLVGRVDPQAYDPLIARLGLAGRVTWHGASDDVTAYFGAADALVLPTQYEPFGLVIVEALACGLPVVTSRLAGASPAVAGAGILLEDPSDVDELVGAMRRVAEDAARAQMAARSEASAAAYAWPAILDRAESIMFGGS